MATGPEEDKILALIPKTEMTAIKYNGYIINRMLISGVLLLKKIYLFERQHYILRETEKKIFSGLAHFPKSPTVRTGTGRSQEPGTPSGSPMWR